MSPSERRHSIRHLGYEAPVEFRQAGRPQTLDLAQGDGGVGQQRLHVHALAARRERRQVAGSAREHIYRAVVVEPAQMMKRDADLQDALVEIADVSPLRAPQQLQRLVLLEEFAAIELRDPSSRSGAAARRTTWVNLNEDD